MSAGLTVMGVSAVVLVVLTALFRAEMKRRERVLLGGVRGGLDAMVLYITGIFGRLCAHLQAGVIRTTMHYIVHHVLEGVISVLLRLQKRLFRVYEKNKWHHNPSSGSENTDPHLTAIAEHKKETALTPAQKRKLRKH